METDTDELPEGARIAGRYRVVRKLGMGGMGSVYEAVQESLGRRVALKVLHPTFAHNAELIARFHREAQAAAQLGHPNIVSVTDFGAGAEAVFLVMELLSGASLATVITREGWLAPGRAAWIATQALSALARAHAAGIVHRDMKPDNLFLTEVSGVRDVVKVLDFGIARFIEEGPNSKLTSAGAVLGTPSYMAPEQAKGRPVDARADVYAVGVMLYEMLTGRLPFQATNYHALLFAILEETPPSIHAARGDVPAGLVAVVERAMARDADARFQSADEMIVALEPFVDRDGAIASVRPPRDPRALSGPTVPDASGHASSAVTSMDTMVGAAPTPTPAPTPAPAPAPAQPVATSDAQPAQPASSRAPSWLPWAGAVALALAGVAGGFALRGASSRPSTTASTTEDGAGPAVEREHHDSSDAGNVPPESLPIAAAADSRSDAATVTQAARDAATATVARAVASRPGRASGGASVASGIGATVPSATSGTSGTGGPPRVTTTVSGGRFPRGVRAEVQSNLGPLMPAIQRCANGARPAPDEGNESGWSMDFVLQLDPSSGAVTTVTPHGDTTRVKVALVTCMRALLLGRTLVSADPPADIEVDFMNRYVQ
jgi:serine/threonine protein kinase